MINGKLYDPLGNGRALDVPAVPAVYAGHWRNGELITPSLPAVRATLPYRWRKAFDRAGGFWFDKHNNSAPATVALRDLRGRHLATLYANPNRLDDLLSDALGIPYRCHGCGRPEDNCSADPCEAVAAERDE